MTRRSQFVDGLRGFAIMCVVLRHYFEPVFPGGAIGVSIFFALSGYLIASILLEGPRTLGGAVSFWIRRIARVYPAYASAALLILALNYAFDHSFDAYARSLPHLLTFTNHDAGWLGMAPGVFWTLYIEFWFYALIPFVLLVAPTNRGFAIALSVVCVISAASMFVHRLPVLPGLLPGDTFRWVHLLICGSLAAVASQSFGGTLRPQTFRAISIACAASLTAIVLLTNNNDRIWAWPVEATASAMITAGWLFAWSKTSEQSRTSPLSVLGTISYSVYLLHAIPLDYMPKLPWPDWQFLSLSKSWGMIAVTVLASAALYHCVERPGIRIGRRLSGVVARRFPRAPSSAPRQI